MAAAARLPAGLGPISPHIDVQANPDANELARKAAGAAARSSKRGKDQVK